MKSFCKYVMCFVFLFPGAAHADSPAPDVPMVTTSSNGEYVFKMVPAGAGSKPFGVASRIQEDGSSKEVWRTEGWYASRVFLSNDGRHLVRMGPWSPGHEPDKDDLAVAFYKEGKLVKEFFTADLVENKSKVQRTVSHYFWLAPGGKPDLTSQNIFHLKTIDGISYSFDITTGEIINKKR